MNETTIELIDMSSRHMAAQSLRELLCCVTHQILNPCGLEIRAKQKAAVRLLVEQLLGPDWVIEEHA
jgi:hypothetical protein